MASEGACWIVAVVITISSLQAVDSVCQCLDDPTRCYDCPCADDIQCAMREDAFSCIITGDIDPMSILHSCSPVDYCPDEPSDRDIFHSCNCDRESQECYQCTRKELLCHDVMRCLHTENSHSLPCQEVLDMMYSCTPVKICEASEYNYDDDDDHEKEFGEEDGHEQDADYYTVEYDDQDSKDDGLVTKISIPAVCLTVITLVTICTVTLALYWKFKIKVIRGRNVNTPMSIMSSTSANQQTKEEPFYSVIDTTAYTESPKVPPNSYQSDGMSAPYEMPATQLSNSLKQKARKIQQYEEPIDSLRKAEAPQTACIDVEKQV